MTVRRPLAIGSQETTMGMAPESMSPVACWKSSVRKIVVRSFSKSNWSAQRQGRSVGNCFRGPVEALVFEQRVAQVREAVGLRDVLPCDN